MRIGAHVTEARFRNNGSHIVGANGEINANDKVELIRRLGELASMISAGEVAALTTEEIASSEKKAELAARRAAALTNAYHSQGNDWAELGAAISGDITTRLERDGFMRTILERNQVDQGALPRIRIRTPNVRAVLSRGPTQIWPQFVRDRYVSTDEFYVTAQPRVEEIELNQGAATTLEDKYFEGLESMLVQEDRHVKRLLDMSVGLYNSISYFSGNLNPATLGLLKTQVESWRLPAANMLFSIDLLNDISFGNDFSTFFDPVSKYEIVMTGRIGRIFGLNMITDGYREPTLQVLDPGEVYITSTPEMTGGYTDRGPVNSRPVDMLQDSVPARGWAMNEIISAIIANGKAVAKAKKI